MTCEEGGGARACCVYASAAVASRRCVTAYCPHSRLLYYAAAARILAYSPQLCRVVGVSEERCDGAIVGLRVVSGPQGGKEPPTMLSLHATGTVSVWQMLPQSSHNSECASVSHNLRRKLLIPNQHAGSVSSGDACFVGSPSSRLRLLVSTVGTDHLIKFSLHCLESGSVLWSETKELHKRALVPELRVVPLDATSDSSTPCLPLVLCGGDDSKVHVWAPSSGRTQPDEEHKYNWVGALPGHRDWVTALDFVYLGDTLMIASGSKDGGVRVWRFLLTSSYLFGTSGNTKSASDVASGGDGHSQSSACTSDAKQLNNELADNRKNAIDGQGGATFAREIGNGQAENVQTTGNSGDFQALQVRPVTLGILGSAVLETVLACHEGAVAHLCWLKRQGLEECNLRLLSCTQTEDRSIIIWQPQNYCNVGGSHSLGDDLATDEDDRGLWVEGARLGEVGGNREGFFSAVFNSDGSAVYAHSYQGGVHEWRAEDTGEWVPQPTISGHFRAVVDCAWEPHGRYLLTCSLDQTTRLHAQVSDGSWHEVCRPQVHGYDMSCVACVSTLSFVSGAEEKVLRTYTAPTLLLARLGQLCDWGPLHELDNRGFVDAAAVPSLGLSNKSLVAQNQPQLQQEFTKNRPTEDTLMAGTLWPEVAKLYGHGHEIMAVAATARHIATSCRAAASQDAAIIVWSAETHQQLQELHHHRLTVTQLCFSNDGCKLLAVSRDRGWSLYQCLPSAHGQFSLLSCSGLLDRATQHARIIWAAAWAPDDSAFITVSRDKTLAVWSPDQAASKEHTPEGLQVWARKTTLKEEDEVTAVAVTAATDEQWLIATGFASGGLRARRYNAVDNKFSDATTLSPSHHSTVRRLTFRPQQEKILLASCGDDNLVLLFNCTTCP